MFVTAIFWSQRSTIFEGFRRTPTFKRYHQHWNSVRNIRKSSPTSSYHSHHCKWQSVTPTMKFKLWMYSEMMKIKFSKCDSFIYSFNAKLIQIRLHLRIFSASRQTPNQNVDPNKSTKPNICPNFHIKWTFSTKMTNSKSDMNFSFFFIFVGFIYGTTLERDWFLTHM